MKKFEGLAVPVTRDNTPEERQYSHCEQADYRGSCDTLDHCSDCIFAVHNLETFKRWEEGMMSEYKDSDGNPSPCL